MGRNKIYGRLRQLYILEFLNAFLLPVGFWYYGQLRDLTFGLNTILAMILASVLLIEGSYLWYCLEGQLKGRMRDEFVATFKILKKVNLSLFLVVTPVIIFNPFTTNYDKVGTVLFLSLAILEQINYFEVQLMYDNLSDLTHLMKHGFKAAVLKRLITREQKR